MEDTKLVPTYPAPVRSVSTPPLVGHVIDDPGDDDEQQMGVAVRNAAIEQEMVTWLIDRSVRALDRYDQHSLDMIADLGQKAKAVHEVFDGDTDIDGVVRRFAVNIVINNADSRQRNRSALGGRLGEVTDYELKPKKKKQPEVIVQAGPKLKPAPLFTRKPKFVIDEE